MTFEHPDSGLHANVHARSRSGRRRGPWSAALLFAVCLAAGIAGLAELAWHFRIFGARADFTLDLEWMEGGMLLHARRLADAQPIYVRPSLDFIPFLYTPLYPALLAALSKVVALGYLLGRAVSIAAFCGAVALVVVSAARALPPSRLARASSLAVGLAGAGAVAASFAFTGTFYDLARPDSLLLFLEAVAVAAAALGAGAPSAALAGVAIVLAFFTKQTAVVVGIGLGLGLLAASWRRALAYGATAAALLGGGLLLGRALSGDWFWTYVYKLHQSHGFNRATALGTAPRMLWQHEAPVLVALVLAVLGLVLSRRWRRGDAVLVAAALAGLVASCIGYATQWAFENAFIPGVYFPVLAAAALAARLAAGAIESRRPGTVILALAAALALGAQSLRAGKPDAAAWVPSGVDRQAAARFLDHLRRLPGDGFVPFHPYYSVLAGKRPFTHRMGVLDVSSALGRPDGLDTAIANQQFPFVVLDWKSQPGEWPFLEQRYRVVHEFREGWDSVRSFSGAATSPRTLLVPVRQPPPVPRGGRVLGDFESGQWGPWTPSGASFGAAPAPSPAHLYGRFAADSGRLGPSPTGRLHSPPIVLDRPQVRFWLAGPPDPRLRVLLLDGPEAVRHASPAGGRAAPVVWDVSTLAGRTVVLVLEDDSPTAALAVDEFATY